MIAVQKGMIIIFTMSLLASSSPKCSDILIMNFQEVLDSIAELRTWEGAHIAWETFQVLLVVGYWAWPGMDHT